MTADSSFINHTRKASEWSSVNGLARDTVPMRLWEKAKNGFWDPQHIDYGPDREQWAAMDEEQQMSVFGLAQGFMIGEEGVTLDILPLIMALSDQGRLEEVMYLTTFAMEEAKHVDFFRLWFDEVGIDVQAMRERMYNLAIENGEAMRDPETDQGLFESELPKVMRTAMIEGTPQAILNASVTYNQFIEGCLALAGYARYAEAFAKFGALPALQEGIRLIRKDESRHITFGTYLCQRVLSENPELVDFATSRLRELRDDYRQPDPKAEAREREMFGKTFLDMVDDQVERRCNIMIRAAKMTPNEVVESEAAEEEEFDISYGTAAGGGGGA